MPRDKKTSQRPLAAFRPDDQPGPGVEDPSRVESQTTLRILFWEAGRRVCPEAFELLERIEIPGTIADDPISYHDERFYIALPRDDREFQFEVDLIRWCTEHHLCVAKGRDAEKISVLGQNGRMQQVRIGGPNARPGWVLDYARATALDRILGSKGSSRPSLLTEALPELSPYAPVRVDTGEEMKGLPREPNARAKNLGWVTTPRRELEPIEWAARRRFRGETPGVIARSISPLHPVNRVHRAIRRIERNLELPTLRPGRPRG